ncbi:MAG TPA: protein kinase [Bryobacteraceae bacterium]|nr:protein kinase [Bryobacteraceae bacterium]
MTLAAGTRLGPYELLLPMGEGGMGEVWKARDTRLDRIVAIKRLKREHSARFEQEARAIAALNHPHICTLHDIGDDYLVMEYVEGSPPCGPMPPEQAVRLALQIAGALEEAHSKGILHRDLKPANILITSKGAAKLLDFGLAKLAVSSDLTQTAAGALMGTPLYMSPEQADGKLADERSEIFSFGAVLYEMLTGKRAFDSIAAVVRDNPAPPPAPPELQRVVMRCLAKQPSERFQNMTELKKSLERAGTKPVDRPQPSIAVLPFANMSRDADDEYFSDGLAEEIINALTEVPGIKVIARTSAFAFKGKNEDIRKIAEALGVTNVLEGSVRRAGTRLRVTAQLIHAADGTHLWSQRYDRELTDVFALQDEISAGIAVALRGRLASISAAFRTKAAAQSAVYTPKLEAYDALLRARYHLNKATPESMAQARKALEEAIALDPDYALPHSDLGSLFQASAIYHILPAHESTPLARAAIQKALDIDPSLPEALANLGSIAAVYDYDWNEAERLFKLVLATGAVSPAVRFSAGAYLFHAGRTSEAIEQLERAVQDDPLNLTCRTVLAFCLMVYREADAERELRRVLERDPSFYLAHHFLDMLHVQRGNLPEALAEAEKAFALAPWVGWVRGFLAGLLAITGESTRAESLLSELGDGAAYGAPFGLFCYHFIRGDMEQAADWVEKAILQRDPALLYPLRLPLLNKLRQSSRWPPLAKMMSLPET